MSETEGHLPTPEQERNIKALAKAVMITAKMNGDSMGATEGEYIAAYSHALATVIAQSPHRAFYEEQLRQQLPNLVALYAEKIALMDTESQGQA